MWSVGLPCQSQLGHELEREDKLGGLQLLELEVERTRLGAIRERKSAIVDADASHIAAQFKTRVRIAIGLLIRILECKCSCIHATADDHI